MQKVYRLSSNASFNYIYKKGGRQVSNLFTIYYVPATSIKVGISVTKKVGNSVVRSLIKRRIKESFRLLIPNLKVKCNYVVLARTDITSVNFKEIDQKLKLLLSRMNHI